MILASRLSPALTSAGEPELLSDGRLGQTYRGYLHSASDERYSVYRFVLH